MATPAPENNSEDRAPQRNEDGQNGEVDQSEDANATDVEESDVNHGDPYDRPSIKDFLERFEITEEDEINQRTAIEFLKMFVGLPNDYEGAEEYHVNHESTGPSEIVVEGKVEAREIVQDLNLWQKHFAVRALNTKLHPEHRREENKLNPSADLVKWLQMENFSRDYFYYRNNHLKMFMQKRGLRLVGGGRATMEKYINALAGKGGAENQDINDGEGQGTATVPQQVMTTKEATIYAVLERSFLPHQKGARRECCSKGHELEIPILKSWRDVLHESEEPDIQGTRLCRAYKAGLAAKNDAPYAKDSIDFIVTVRNDPTRTEEGVSVWGFEAKGRVTTRPQADEEWNMRGILNPHVRIFDDQVYYTVRDVGERFQVLQHAFVYDLGCIVLAISDHQSELIRSTIINFSARLKKDFGVVLKDLYDLCLSWAYPSDSDTWRRMIIQIPEEINTIAQSIKTINGNETLQGTINLWNELNRLPKPFPSMKRCIPGVCAFWNQTKGGSDTTTKLMDDCLIQIPKPHMNTETVAVSRSIGILFVLSHRLSQAFTARKQYSTLLKYRKAASKRTTYHETLLKAHHLFEKKLNQLKTENAASASALTIQNNSFRTPSVARRQQPSRCRIDGAIPVEIDFAPKLPFKTPANHGHLIRNGKEDPRVSEMVRKCTGIPMKAYPPASNKHRCDICNHSTNKTSWYCVGCKRWIHMDRRAVDNNGNELQLYQRDVKQKKTFFVTSCFHESHAPCWKELNITQNQYCQYIQDKE